MSKGKDVEKVNSQASSAKKNKTAIIVASVAGVIILVMAGTIYYLIATKPVPTAEPAQERVAANTVVTAENIEEVIAELDAVEYTPVGSYEVSMNTKWFFPDGSSPSSNAFVDNVVNNTNTVYFTVELESAMGVEIYRSPYLEVGARLNNIQFDQVLEAGTYDAIVTYHLVDSEFREMSSVSMGISLVVEN